MTSGVIAIFLLPPIIIEKPPFLGAY